jgi:hypothetical protein
VALTGGAAGEEHGGSRAKCDEEKAKVKFASTMEVAQGIRTVRKPWAGACVGDARSVGGGCWSAQCRCGRHAVSAISFGRGWGAHAVKGLCPAALGQAKLGGLRPVSNGSGLHCSYGPGPVNPFQIFQRLSKYQTDSNL